MQIERLNQEIFSLPDGHSAHRFIRAFIECRLKCVGREASDDPVDQEWFSESEGRLWSYSEFAYQFLAFDIVLDGWLTHAAERTRDEQYWLCELPRWHTLLHECRIAAENDDNVTMLPVIAQVLKMFALWEQCIIERDAATDDEYPKATRDSGGSGPTPDN